MATLEWLCDVPEWQILDGTMREMWHIMRPADFDFIGHICTPHDALDRASKQRGRRRDVFGAATLVMLRLSSS